MGLGAGAVEYIICHAGISIAFAEETKVSEVRSIGSKFSIRHAQYYACFPFCFLSSFCLAMKLFKEMTP